MIFKPLSRSAVSVLGCVFILSLCIGLPGAIAEEEPEPCTPGVDGCIYGCTDDADFTTEFRFQDCGGFKTYGVNPYFILKPGYYKVLEGVEEDEDTGESTFVREEITVQCDTKWIKLELDGRTRWIKTRVVEERALERENVGDDWVTIEISLNWFAICNRTNDVVYFGEDSRDCPDGFDENDVCEGGADPAGSWEAGKPPMGNPDGVIAKPGIIMPGTPLIGAKYFQEIAPPDAVDRGEIVAVGFDEGEWSGCIEINDTNPAEGACDLGEDVKIYCPGVGVVADQVLEIVWSGYVGCDDDYDDDDDDDDDDDKRKRKRWSWWR